VKPKPAPNLTNNGQRETVARYSTAETNPDKPGDRETLDRPPLQQLSAPTNTQQLQPAYDYGKFGGGSFSTVAPYSLKFNSYGTVSGLGGGFDYQPIGFGGPSSYSSVAGLSAASTFPLSGNYGATSTYSSALPSGYLSSVGFGTAAISPAYSVPYKPTSYLPASSTSYLPLAPLSSDPYFATYKPYEAKPVIQYGSLQSSAPIHPQSPVDVFSLQTKSPDNIAAERTARVSPLEKQSLSPVEQLETPERKEKQNRNLNVGIPNNGSNSS